MNHVVSTQAACTTVRAAIIGCGRISQLHAMGYTGLTNASVVAVCDTDARLARGNGQAWGAARVYTDYRKVLEDDDINLVELVVPHHLHADMAVEACRAGKHVSVQKPMARTLEEADRMIAAARTAGVVLRVYENFVFYPPIVRACEMIQAGEIGAPQMIRLHYNSGRRDSAWDVPLRSWLWRFDEKKCGGGPIVFDHGYHLFSVARFLMGEVERVSAWIDRTAVAPAVAVDAPATIMLKFRGHRYGVMDFCHTPGMVIESEYYADDNRIEIVGDKGIIFVNRCTAQTIDLPPLVLFRDGETSEIPVNRPGWEDSFVDCTRHLVNVLTLGGEPMLDGEAGRKVLQIQEAVARSARERREVEVGTGSLH
jgi:predicted dehydrogenase